MINELKDFAQEVSKLMYRFLSHCLLWLIVVMAVLFYMLLARLFELQITLHYTFRAPPPRTSQVTRPIPALRGTIYDRHGRPLAINKPTFVVKMDPSVLISNEALLELSLLLERNNEEFVDDFPIYLGQTKEFTFSGTNPDAVLRREHR